MDAAARKQAQRRRDRLMGWAEVTVRVDQRRAAEIRAYAATLPPPAPPTDPAQLSLLAELDALIDGGDASREPELF